MISPEARPTPTARWRCCDFDPLRAREDFKKLLAELERKWITDYTDDTEKKRK